MIKHLVKAEQVSSFNIVLVRLLSVVSAGPVSKTVYFVAMYPVHKRSRFISVCKATVLRAGRSWVRIQVNFRDVCFPLNVQASYSVSYGFFLQGLKQRGCETNHSTASSVEVKNAWI